METTITITLESKKEIVVTFEEAESLYETLKDVLKKEPTITYPTYPYYPYPYTPPYVPWSTEPTITYCRAFSDGSTEVGYSDGTCFNVVSSK